MVNLKGQSAIEYLMTYGWMLLVIAIVGGLLFALFQDQELEGQTVEGFEGDDIRVEEVTADNGSVQLSLTSYSSEDIESAELCLNHDDFNKSCSESFSIARLNDETLTLDSFNDSNDTYTYDISVNYETSSGLTDTVEGTGNLEAKSTGNTDEEDEQPSENPETSYLSVRNASGNVSSVSQGGSVELSAEANASETISKIKLATNESGNMKNISNKGSGFTDTDSDGFIEASFTWSNDSITGETIQWKTYFTTSTMSNSTDTKTFQVESGSSSTQIVDGFEDGNLDEYSNVENYTLNVQNEVVSSGSYAVKVNRSKEAEGSPISTSGLDKYPQRGDKINFSLRVSSSTGPSPTVGLIFGGKNSTHFYMAGMQKDGDFTVAKVEGGGTPSKFDLINTDANSDQWYNVQIDYDSQGDGNISMSLYDMSGNQIGGESVIKDTEFQNRFVGLAAGNPAEGYLDSIKIVN